MHTDIVYQIKTNKVMEKYILIIGDEVIGSGSERELTPLYEALVKVYERDKRPSKKPSLFKLVKTPPTITFNKH